MRAEYLSPSGNPNTDYPIFSGLRDNEKLGAVLSPVIENCVSKRNGGLFIGPALVPLVIAGGKLAFDLYTDNLKGKIENLKRSAVRPYDVGLIMARGALDNEACIGIVRKSKDKEDFGLVLILKLTTWEPQLLARGPKPDAFYLSPVFLWVGNTGAVTAKPSGQEKGAQIDMSIAVAVKMISRVKDAPALAELGQGVIDLPHVQLEGAPSCIVKRCDRSSLIPLPDGHGSVEIRVGWTEIGDVGFDVDRAAAETEAIKAAIGPAVENVLQFHFDRTDNK